MKLVETKRGNIYTDSLIYAEEFDIRHKHLMEKIRNLTDDLSALKKENFIEKDYYILEDFTNSRGRKYERYLITKKGFTLLVMNTDARGEKKLKLVEIQDKFIDAFFEMEKQLATLKVNQQNVEWNKTREQGKSVRLELTDTVKDFVDYATNQGSKSAKMYYMNITKMEYKALGMVESDIKPLRDLLNAMQLFQIIMAEDLVKRQMKRYMEQNIHYKQIYLLVKQDVERFAKSFLIN
ncbi:MAG: Rha family transcriptional regulator [Fusobacteriaceae bacterium]